MAFLGSINFSQKRKGLRNQLIYLSGTNSSTGQQGTTLRSERERVEGNPFMDGAEYHSWAVS